MIQDVIHISLRISADEYQKLYAGAAKSVFARSTDGRKIRFPASILRPFVTYEGISGYFAIYFDEENRFVSIKKLG